MVAESRKWDYALHIMPNDFLSFWGDRLRSGNDFLLIAGLGWDPRMSTSSECLKKCVNSSCCTIDLINYRPYDSFVSPYSVQIKQNYKRIIRLTKGWAKINTIDILTRNSDNKYIGDISVTKSYIDRDIGKYSDVLLDISALPKSIYFSLLNVIVGKIIRDKLNVNLHVIVCQYSELDSIIVETIDDPRYLHGFKFGINITRSTNTPKIWVPLLAKRQKESIKSLIDLTEPRDIYPILPFPSKNPREDDEILTEYSDVFTERAPYDKMNFDLMNFIYATEDEPIDVYQSIVKLHKQQHEALGPLGGIIMILSPLSSKLSSLGAFMAAFEKKIAVAHTIGRHNIPDEHQKEYWSDTNYKEYMDSMHSIWLTGEPYEK